MLEEGLRDRIRGLLNNAEKSPWNDSEKRLLEDLNMVYDPEDEAYMYLTDNDNLVFVQKDSNFAGSIGILYRVKVIKMDIKNQKVYESVNVKGERDLWLAIVKYKKEY